MLRRLLGNKGFSLVEIMVAVGLVGALSLGVAQLMKQSTDSANFAEVKTEEGEIYRQVSLVLQDKVGCTNSLVGLPLNSSVPQILNGKGAVAFTKGASYGNNSLELTDIRVVEKGALAADESGVAALVLDMKRKKVKSARPTSSKEIMINVKLGPDSKILSCYGLLDELVSNNNKLICEKGGGTWIPATSTCEYTDCDTVLNTNIVSTYCMNQKALYKTGGTVTGPLAVVGASAGISINGSKLCIDGNCRDFSPQGCPNGFVVIGVKSDGTMDCQPAVKAVEASPVDCKGAWSSCSSLCGPGTQTYNISQPAANGGAACPIAPGTTQSCNSGTCVNCQGSFGSCSKTCGGGTQTFSISQAAGPGGSSCAYSDGATQACNTQPCLYLCPNQPNSGCTGWTRVPSGSGSSVTYAWSCTTNTTQSHGPSTCTGGLQPTSTCTYWTQNPSCPGVVNAASRSCGGISHQVNCVAQ